MSAYSKTLEQLRAGPGTWLVTGAAGFIGSHLTESLLKLGQHVIGLDDLSTGSRDNLADVQARVAPEAWGRFRFIEGSVCDFAVCTEACSGVDYVLHEAGFISVPQSIEDPLTCNAVNVDGFLNMLVASQKAGVKRLVYASSSAVYGDDKTMPQIESKIGRPLSPYGTSKWIDELYADVFFKNHGFEAVGLRYFNVFGPRQNPSGGYAAVIPQWISALVAGRECHINGDGSITRDFCHVNNIVQANLLAATTVNPAAPGNIFNVALGGQTTLTQLYGLIAGKLAKLSPGIAGLKPVYGPPRPGDIIHSSADISKIRNSLGYDPAVSVDGGLDETVAWYAAQR
jgi:UDP-N-acetylglucosamine 4-epimerase